MNNWFVIKKGYVFTLLIAFQFLMLHPELKAQATKDAAASVIDLSGTWRFQIDSLDKGIAAQWFSKTLEDQIQLPGSMSSNGKGDDVTADTKWTGNFWNPVWYKDSAYAKYRQQGNVKISFWLQPLKHYVGVAWYQKKVNIPAAWKDRHLEIFLERCHWETTLWVDNRRVGMQNALGAPHRYDLGGLTPGEHTITLRMDNRVKDINPGLDAHSISDNTQTNWNGIVGGMRLVSKPAVFVSDVQVYPDVAGKKLRVQLAIYNQTGKKATGQLTLAAEQESSALPAVKRHIDIQGDTTFLDLEYPMGSTPRLWDEFHPELYTLRVVLSGSSGMDKRAVRFGMRQFAAQGQQLTVNGRPVFLRGTLECAIFPKTGYPPTDLASWERIFRICRSYGLNHMRFHSWCPPEAAFEAADHAGFYLSVECSAWATLGDGKAIDQFIYEESHRIVSSFGNHPSFCMMPYGNEPSGKQHEKYLRDFVHYWKSLDNRRLYTAASGWPSIPENEYNVTPAPRIQHWGEGVNSMINREAPHSSYDWDTLVPSRAVPTISHEIGQWCVYPNFKEMPKYDGVLRPRNFEIFQERLKDHGLSHLADSFLLASGKLQVLCYKADIEAALRTPKFGGFQLLDLHDFPGQGTALVGVLDPFWDEKGYVTSREFSRFCNATVPLVRLPKMVYLNSETLSVPVEIAHFGEAALKNVIPVWKLKNAAGAVLFQGQLPRVTIPVGNGIQLGTIQQSLASVTQPGKLVLTVAVDTFENTWDLFVYPAALPQASEDVWVTGQLDAKTLQALQSGSKVLLSPKQGSIKAEIGGSIPVGFSSIFWNTSWTNGQPPHTLGILCNPAHPALALFPTQYHSNWQWWDAMRHCNAIRLDSVAPQLQPIVRVIDDWFTARPLGLVFECKVGKGKLLLSAVDLLSDIDKRPEARQLLYSFTTYMASRDFDPAERVAIEKIKTLFNN